MTQPEPPNLWLQLEECCRVLTEELDWNVAVRYEPAAGEPPAFDEKVTALWQTVELAQELALENEQAWQAVFELRLMVNDLQAKLDHPRLVVPHVTLPRDAT